MEATSLKEHEYNVVKIENSEYYLQKLITKNDEIIELRVSHPETGFVQSATKIIKVF